jgi:hypothetical protein
MWCSNNYYHKNKNVRVSQAWMTLFSCTHVMITRHVYIYWKWFSVWSQSYRLYSWISHRSYRFCSVATISWRNSLWFEAWSMSRHMMSMQKRRFEMTMMTCMLIRDVIDRWRDWTCVLILNAKCLRCLTDWCRFRCTNRNNEDSWCWWLRFRMIVILMLTNDKIRIRELNE